MKWNFLLACVFSALVARPALAEDCMVGMVHSPMSVVKASQLARLLEDTRHHGIHLIDAPIALLGDRPGSFCAIITTDPIAWDAVNAHLAATPAIATFLTRSNYHPADHHGPSTAIYYDADPNQVIQLLDDLVARPKDLVFLGRPTIPLRPEAKGRNRIEYIEADSVSEFFQEANRYAHADYFIATPGFTPLNAETFQVALEMFRSRSQGLIGFTEGMTRSGALLSVYPTEADIAKKVKVALMLLRQKGTLPSPTVVESFQWSKNDWIAAVLNMPSVTPPTEMQQQEMTAYSMPQGRVNE